MYSLLGKEESLVMQDKTAHISPRRVTDLIEMVDSGSKVTCEPSFEIVPVDFVHREYQFQAHIFLCRYSGKVDETTYEFRKCYARGCPDNLCPHVTQAVMIANRYLHRDFYRMRQSGISVGEQMFSLQDMMVKFGKLHPEEEKEPLLTIHDYINIAKEGNRVSVEVLLESIPAVENFANEHNKQTYLVGEFNATTLGRTGRCQQCLSCYATEERTEEEPQAVVLANQRLALLYQEFNQQGIKYDGLFF